MKSKLVRRGGSIRAILAIAVVVLGLLEPRHAVAAGDPDLVWWTIETEHFRITYPHPLEAVARRLAPLCEEIHDRLEEDLAFTPEERTEILLTDDSDSANGSASPIPYNAIRLFATAPDDISALGDYDDWLLELVTHEYTHTLHTGNISGAPAVVNAILGRTIAPNSVQPRWIIEGLATVYESEHTSGGRVRSSLFDMYIRADVLADNIAGLDQISSNATRWPQGNLFYLYGSRFLRWVMDIYGKDTMSAVSNDYGATLIPFGINRAIRRQTGRTYVELYEGFQQHLRRRYGAQIAEVEARGLREGKRLTHHGRIALYPAFVPPVAQADPSRLEIAYYRDDQNLRRGIYRLSIDRSDPDDVDLTLLARTSSTSPVRFSAKGDLLFNSTEIYENVYGRSELFWLPRGETSPRGDEPERAQLTFGLRASDPDVDPTGRLVVYAANDAGTRTLSIADRTPEGALTGHRVLVPSAQFDQAYTPRFSPNGKYVAYSSWTAGGYRDIRVVEVDTGRYQSITRDRAMDMQPTWSADGKTIYFSSDRTGIFNVYAYDVETRELLQVTNVRTGALCPSVSADGKYLAYAGYTTIGHDLYLMELDPKRFLPALPPPADRPDPHPAPPAVALERKPYNPWPTLRPRAYSLELTSGIYDANALRVAVSGADIVGHHAFAGSITVEADAPSPRMTLDYLYGRLPFNLTARLFHTPVPRSGYRINDQEIEYDETTNGLTTGIAYPVLGVFGNHNFGFSYSAALFSGDLPVGDALDPYATRTIDPPSGYMGVFTASYSYSNTEGSTEASGPIDGVSFRLSADYADEATGSDYSLRVVSATASTYFLMPWPGHQTLLWRSSGGVSSGSFPRRSLFFVGGPNLEEVSLIDVLTTGVFDSSFELRGYPASAYSGSEFLLQTFEYRFPMLFPDHGVSTLPVFLRRVDGALFLDYGGAFENLDLDRIKLFRDGDVVSSPDLHAAVGGELWLGLTLGYRADARIRVGYAYGFSAAGYPGGQVYVQGSAGF